MTVADGDAPLVCRLQLPYMPSIQPYRMCDILCLAAGRAWPKRGRRSNRQAAMQAFGNTRMLATAIPTAALPIKSMWIDYLTEAGPLFDLYRRKEDGSTCEQYARRV